MAKLTDHDRKKISDCLAYSDEMAKIWEYSDIEVGDTHSYASIVLLRKYNLTEQEFNDYIGAYNLARSYFGDTNLDLNNIVCDKVFAECLSYNQSGLLQNCSVDVSKFIIRVVDQAHQQSSKNWQLGVGAVDLASEGVGTRGGHYTKLACLLAKTGVRILQPDGAEGLAKIRKAHLELIEKISKGDLPEHEALSNREQLLVRIGLLAEVTRDLDLSADISNVYLTSQMQLMAQLQEVAPDADVKEEVENLQKGQGELAQQLSLILHTINPAKDPKLYKWERNLNTAKAMYHGIALLAQHTGHEELANQIMVIGDAGMNIASALRDIAQGAIASGPLMPYMIIAGAVSTIFSAIHRKREASPFQIILTAVQQLATMVSRFRDMMESRLDQIEKKIAITEWETIQAFISLEQDISQLKGMAVAQHNSVMGRLTTVQAQINDAAKDLYIADFESKYKELKNYFKFNDDMSIDKFKEFYNYFVTIALTKANHDLMTGRSRPMEVFLQQQYSPTFSLQDQCLVPENNIGKLLDFAKERKLFDKYSLSITGISNPLVLQQAIEAVVFLLKKAPEHYFKEQVTAVDELISNCEALNNIINCMHNDRSVMNYLLEIYQTQLSDLQTELKLFEKKYQTEKFLKPLQMRFEREDRPLLEANNQTLASVPDLEKRDDWEGLKDALYNKFDGENFRIIRSTNICSAYQTALRFQKFYEQHVKPYNDQVKQLNQKFDELSESILEQRFSLFPRELDFSHPLAYYMVASQNNHPANKVLLNLDHNLIRQFVPLEVIAAERLNVGRIHVEYITSDKTSDFRIKILFRMPGQTYEIALLNFNVDGKPLDDKRYRFDGVTNPLSTAWLAWEQGDLISTFLTKNTHGQFKSYAGYAEKGEGRKQFTPLSQQLEDRGNFQVKINKQAIQQIKQIYQQRLQMHQEEVRQQLQSAVTTDSKLSTICKNLGYTKLLITMLLHFCYANQLMGEPVYKNFISCDGVWGYLELINLLTKHYKGSEVFDSQVDLQLEKIKEFEMQFNEKSHQVRTMPSEDLVSVYQPVQDMLIELRSLRCELLKKQHAIMHSQNKVGLFGRRDQRAEEPPQIKSKPDCVMM